LEKTSPTRQDKEKRRLLLVGHDPRREPTEKNRVENKKTGGKIHRCEGRKEALRRDYLDGTGKTKESLWKVRKKTVVEITKKSRDHRHRVGSEGGGEKTETRHRP